MSREPAICCLCPTYKRPEMLASVVACFLAQEYRNKRLIICDDAYQFHTQSVGGGSVYLMGRKVRFPNLPEKFNYLEDTAFSLWQPEIYCVWEDDDVYFPWHLKSIAQKWHHLKGDNYFFVQSKIWSTYEENHQGCHIEEATGRFHASWAFSSGLFHNVGGYSVSDRLIYDQEMGGKLSHYGNQIVIDDWGGTMPPSYVYRWGNPTYHGSAQGEAGYRMLWDAVGKMPAPHIGALVPKFDAETKLLFDRVPRINCDTQYKDLV